MAKDKDELRMTLKGCLYGFGLEFSNANKKKQKQLTNKLSKELNEGIRQVLGVGLVCGRKGMLKGMEEITSDKKLYEKLESGLYLLHDVGFLDNGGKKK